ncbi:hypothetical protein [Clostridium tyrobutyricum]|jgi:histone H3/H4|uniref:hypothetical protein n=1 Tax=Clostridium tyrobutyricum TaxID=1519 RepID=UPI001C384B52|nr:hypothetical protein [Clostridium tyrobutyricum]MBV4429081.1 hypothetical protein [Clostridium tyrobutyricum]MBV4444158.1 hypothetical protein [Clostridium tyrobutyricum]
MAVKSFLNLKYEYWVNSDVKPVLTMVQEVDSELAKKYKRRLSGRTIKQVDSEFWDYILELFNTASKFTQEEKNKTVEDMTEYYYRQSGGYQCPPEMLFALADFILDDSLTDKSVDKVKNTEYPFLCYKQLKRRRKRDFSADTDIIDFFSTKQRYNIAIKKSKDDKFTKGEKS